MKIVSREKAKFFDSSEGRKIWKYGFPEYEFQYDQQLPHTILKWHRHAQIWETIYIIEGELVAKWKKGEETKERIVRAGDAIEPGHVWHTFENRSDEVAKFVAFKQVLAGRDMKETIEKDKIYNE